MAQFILILQDKFQSELVLDGDGGYVETYETAEKAAETARYIASIYEHYTGYIVAEIKTEKLFGGGLPKKNP